MTSWQRKLRGSPPICRFLLCQPQHLQLCSLCCFSLHPAFFLQYLLSRWLIFLQDLQVSTLENQDLFCSSLVFFLVVILPLIRLLLCGDKGQPSRHDQGYCEKTPCGLLALPWEATPCNELVYSSRGSVSKAHGRLDKSRIATSFEDICLLSATRSS